MGALVVILLVSIVLAIVFLSHHPVDQQLSRKKYLSDMAQYLGGSLRHMEQYENAYQVQFVYQGKEFTFEDIRDSGLDDRIFSKGHLRIRVPVNFTLNFTEVQRSSLIARGSSTSGVIVPPQLNQFDVFTNSPEKANALLKDDEIIKIFLKYKNVDQRGHPIMSLEIKEGEIVLQFHSPGENLKPNLVDLQFNVPSIEDYLKRLLLIVKKLEDIKDME